MFCMKRKINLWQVILQKSCLMLIIACLLFLLGYVLNDLVMHS